MPETRHRTTIEIGVDDRQVRRLGQTLERALDSRIAASFERMMERSTRQVEKLLTATSRLEGKMRELQRSQQRMGGRAARGAVRGAMMGGYMGGSMGGRQGGYAAAAHAGLQRAGGTLGGVLPVSEGFTASLLSAIPYLGPALGGVMNAANQYYNMYAGYSMQRAAAAGVTGGAVAAPGLTRLGMALPQQMQFMQQLAQQSGRRGRSLSAIASHEGELARYMGFHAGGTYIGGLEAGGMGPREDASTLLSEAIAVGLARGVREARIDQYLQATAQFAEQARTSGINLNPQAIETMMMQLPGGRGSGFRGRAGQQAALGIAQGLRGAGQGSDAFSFLAMRAAGYTGREGGLSFMQAQLRLEEQPQEVFAVMMREMLARGGDPEAVAAFIQQGARGLGIQLSTRQALSLANMDPEQLRSHRMERAQMGEAFEGLLHERAHGGVGRMVREGGADAAIQNQRIGLGGRVSGDMRRIIRMEQRVAGAVLPMAMGAIGRTMQGVTRLMDAYRRGGFGAVMAEIATMTAEGVGQASEALENTIPAGTEVELGTGAEQLGRLFEGETVEFTGDEATDRAMSEALRQQATLGLGPLGQIPGVREALGGAIGWIGETMRGHGEARQETYTEERGLGSRGILADGTEVDIPGELRRSAEAQERAAAGLEAQRGMGESDAAGAVD